MIVNTVVDVYWPEDDAWYRAQLTGYDPGDQRHYIAYDDDGGGVGGWATLTLSRPPAQSPSDHLQYRPVMDGAARADSTGTISDTADSTGEQADRAHDTADRTGRPADRAYNTADSTGEQADRAYDTADRTGSLVDRTYNTAESTGEQANRACSTTNSTGGHQHPNRDASSTPAVPQYISNGCTYYSAPTGPVHGPHQSATRYPTFGQFATAFDHQHFQASDEDVVTPSPGVELNSKPTGAANKTAPPPLCDITDDEVQPPLSAKSHDGDHDDCGADNRMCEGFTARGIPCRQPATAPPGNDGAWWCDDHDERDRCGGRLHHGGVCCRSQHCNRDHTRVNATAQHCNGVRASITVRAQQRSMQSTTDPVRRRKLHALAAAAAQNVSDRTLLLGEHYEDEADCIAAEITSHRDDDRAADPSPVFSIGDTVTTIDGSIATVRGLRRAGAVIEYDNGKLEVTHDIRATNRTTVHDVPAATRQQPPPARVPRGVGTTPQVTFDVYTEPPSLVDPKRTNGIIEAFDIGGRYESLVDAVRAGMPALKRCIDVGAEPPEGTAAHDAWSATGRNTYPEYSNWADRFDFENTNLRPYVVSKITGSAQRLAATRPKAGACETLALLSARKATGTVRQRALRAQTAVMTFDIADGESLTDAETRLKSLRLDITNFPAREAALYSVSEVIVVERLKKVLRSTYETAISHFDIDVGTEVTADDVFARCIPFEAAPGSPATHHRSQPHARAFATNASGCALCGNHSHSTVGCPGNPEGSEHVIGWRPSNDAQRRKYTAFLKKNTKAMQAHEKDYWAAHRAERDAKEADRGTATKSTKPSRIAGQLKTTFIMPVIMMASFLTTALATPLAALHAAEYPKPLGAAAPWQSPASVSQAGAEWFNTGSATPMGSRRYADKLCDDGANYTIVQSAERVYDARPCHIPVAMGNADNSATATQCGHSFLQVQGHPGTFVRVEVLVVPNIRQDIIAPASICKTRVDGSDVDNGNVYSAYNATTAGITLTDGTLLPTHESGRLRFFRSRWTNPPTDVLHAFRSDPTITAVRRSGSLSNSSLGAATERKPRHFSPAAMQTTAAYINSTDVHTSMRPNTVRAHPRGRRPTAVQLPAANMSLASQLLRDFHRRWAHLNLEDCCRLLKRSGVDVSARDRAIACRICAQAKLTRKRSRTGASLITPPGKFYGDLLHMDVAHMAHTSRLGYKYALVIVDDYSRMVHCIPLRRKSDTAEAFDRFMGTVAPHRPPTDSRWASHVRSDGGGEFTGDAFQRVLTKHSVRFTRSPPGHPNANGVVERMVRTLRSSLAAAMLNKRVSPQLWPEALDHVVALRNRSPTSANPDRITPLERVLGIEHGRAEGDYYMRRVTEFGSRCETKCRDRPNAKSPRTRPGMIIGLSTTSFAHRVLHDDGTRVETVDVQTFAPPVDEARPCDGVQVPDSADDTDFDVMLPVPDTPLPTNINCIDSHGPDSLFSPDCHDLLRVHASTTDDHTDTVDPVPVALATPTHAADATSYCNSVNMAPINDDIGHVDPADTNFDHNDTFFNGDIDATEPVVHQATCNDDFDMVHPVTDQRTGDLLHGSGRLTLSADPDRPSSLCFTPATRFTDNPQANSARGGRPVRETVLGMLTPGRYEDLSNSPQRDQWQSAWDSENDSWRSNEVLDVIPRSQLPAGSKVCVTRPLFKIKTNPDGSFDKMKVRRILRGDRQHASTYTETFAAVINTATVSIMIALAAANNTILHGFDIKTAYLAAPIDVDNLYCEVPPRYIDDRETYPDLVAHVRKGIYGTKQGAFTFYCAMTAWLATVGLHPSSADPCLYVGTYTASDGRTGRIAIGLYCDDGMIQAAPDQQHLVDDLITRMRERFHVTDLGRVSSIIGMSLDWTPAGIFVSQRGATDKLMGTCGFSTSGRHHSLPLPPGTNLSRHPPTPAELSECANRDYRGITGSLLWLLHTRPELSVAVAQATRFMAGWGPTQWAALESICCYLGHNRDLGLMYQAKPATANELVCYTDASHCDEPGSGRSTIGYTILLNGASIKTKSMLSPVVCSSTAQSEHVGLAMATREVLWAREVLTALGYPPNAPTTMYCDNQPAIAMVTSTVPTHGWRHVLSRLHFTREHANGHAAGGIDNQMHVPRSIDVQYVNTTDQAADITTKVLPGPAQRRHNHTIGLRSRADILNDIRPAVAAAGTDLGPLRGPTDTATVSSAADRPTTVFVQGHGNATVTSGVHSNRSRYSGLVRVTYPDGSQYHVDPGILTDSGNHRDNGADSAHKAV